MSTKNNLGTAIKVLVSLAILAMLAFSVLVFSVAAIWYRRQAPQVTTVLRVRAAAAPHPPGDALHGTQGALIRSPFVANQALRKPGIEGLSILHNLEDPPKWIREHMTVKRDNGSDLIRVSLTSWNVEEAKLLLDAIVEAYVDEIVSAERTQSESKLEKLKEARFKIVQDIEHALQELTEREAPDRSPQRRQVELELIKQQRSRLEEAMLRVELELAGASADDQHTSDLRAQRMLLQEKLAANTEQLDAAVDGDRHAHGAKSNLAALQDVKRKLDEEIIRSELEAATRPRIQILQTAMPSHG